MLAVYFWAEQAVLAELAELEVHFFQEVQAVEVEAVVGQICQAELVRIFLVEVVVVLAVLIYLEGQAAQVVLLEVQEERVVREVRLFSTI